LEQHALLDEVAFDKREALLGDHCTRAAAASLPEPPPRRLAVLLCTPDVAVAVVCGMAAQWTMVLLMTGLPLAMVNKDGFAFGTYATTIQVHLVAMFLPGVASGYCADRFGPLPLLLGGCVVAGGAVQLGRMGDEALWSFNACLVAVGVGWNFLAVGSTKLLLASHTKDEAPPIEVRARLVLFLLRQDHLSSLSGLARVLLSFCFSFCVQTFKRRRLRWRRFWPTAARPSWPVGR
jgi:MFS family permease